MTSIFRYSKNYGSLTHETKIKDAVNMEDLICLLATVRTLNAVLPLVTMHGSTYVMINSCTHPSGSGSGCIIDQLQLEQHSI